MYRSRVAETFHGHVARRDTQLRDALGRKESAAWE
jgi:hypothetical protein